MKMKNKKYFLKGMFTGMAVLFSIVLAALGILISRSLSETVGFLEFQGQPVSYSLALEESLEELQESGFPIAVYAELGQITVTSPDFNRSSEGIVLCIAGDASLLFPGSNALPAGEERYCLLGKDLALDLFGSIRVNGRTVRVDGKSCFVAGIARGKRWADYCIYRAKPGDGAEMDCAAYGFSSRWERQMAEKRAEGILGITGSIGFGNFNWQAFSCTRMYIFDTIGKY